MGENTSVNQVLLRAPGTAQDSAANGGLHLRGEHANLQYRINDVLLPEGITGFGQELSPRFIDSLHLITGSLPAQYGFRTAGIVDLHTKSGAFEPGGAVSMYGGRYDTINPSFEYGGSGGSGYGRISGVHFKPDPIGDLYFDGVASDVDRKRMRGLSSPISTLFPCLNPQRVPPFD